MQRGMGRSCLRFLIYYRGRVFSNFLPFFWSLYTDYPFFALTQILTYYTDTTLFTNELHSP